MRGITVCSCFERVGIKNKEFEVVVRAFVEIGDGRITCVIYSIWIETNDALGCLINLGLMEGACRVRSGDAILRMSFSRAVRTSRISLVMLLEVL